MECPINSGQPKQYTLSPPLSHDDTESFSSGNRSEAEIDEVKGLG